MYGYSLVRRSGGCPLYTPDTHPRHGKNPHLMPRVNLKKKRGSQDESASVRKERCGGGKIKPLRRGG